MKKLFVIALAAVGMVACVNDEIVETPQGNAISFDNAFIDNATRAELDATTLAEFKVWGYIDADGTQVPLFEGTEVTKTSGDWTYGDGARYWAPDRMHYFQAIAPLTTDVAAVHANGEVSAINYTVDGDSDLIYAAYNKVGADAGETNGPVSFNFGHLLSKVEFEFVNGFAAEDHIDIAVKNVKMTVPAKGTYDIETGKWTVNPTVAGNKTLENIDEAQFVLPYDNSYAYAIEFDVDVTYGGVEINKDVHKTSSVMVALNKGTAYKFTATINAETLNMESIDFEVGEVGDWTPGGDSTLGTAYISTADALQAALNNPDVDTIVLSEDVTLTEALTVDATSRTRSAVEPVAVTLDLNGKTIKNANDYVIENYGGNLIILGNGGRFEGMGGIRSHSGKLTINGGTYTASSDWNNGTYQHILKAVNTEVVIADATFDATIGGITNAMINVSEGSIVTINSGSFKNVEGEIPTFAPYMFTYEGNGKLIINGGDFYGGWRFNGPAATTDIYAGNFSVGYDGQSFHASSTHVLTVYGGNFTEIANGSLTRQLGNVVADGYAAILRDGKYVVLPACDDAAALQEAINAGGTVVLSGDVEVAEPIVISDGVNVVLDLNGKTITATHHKNVGAVLKNEGTLTITGGTISSTADNGGSAIMNTGTLTVKDATLNGAPNAGGEWPSYSVNNTGTMTLTNCTITSYHGAVASYGENAVLTLDNSVIDMSGIPGFTSHGIYTYNSGKVVVNGGTYENKATDQGSTGASVINGAVEVNDGTFSGRIENYYGTPVLKGGVYSVKPNANFVAAGFHAVEKDGKYVVLPEGVDAVAGTTEELKDAISNGDNVMLEEDVTYGTAINNDANIDLNGNTFEATGTINLGNNSDLTMKGGDYEVNGTYGHVDVRPSTAEGSVVVFEDIDFSYNKLSKTYGPSTNRLGSVVEVCGTTAGAHTQILFKNCTFANAQVLFEGLSNTTSTFEATFEECTFNALTSSAPIDVQNYVEGTINVIGCTFNLECTSSTASAISVSSSSDTTVTVNAQNNTINATAATPSGVDGTVEQVKVNGTPKDIKFISAYDNTTVNETNTIKNGIAK